MSLELRRERESYARRSRDSSSRVGFLTHLGLWESVALTRTSSTSSPLCSLELHIIWGWLACIFSMSVQLSSRCAIVKIITSNQTERICGHPRCQRSGLFRLSKLRPDKREGRFRP